MCKNDLRGQEEPSPTKSETDEKDPKHVNPKRGSMSSKHKKPRSKGVKSRFAGSRSGKMGPSQDRPETNGKEPIHTRPCKEGRGPR